jgi:hypothetical protein
MQKICKIGKQYAGFHDISLYCMQYAKYAKNMHDSMICKICKRHFQYAGYAHFADGERIFASSRVGEPESLAQRQYNCLKQNRDCMLD